MQYLIIIRTVVSLLPAIIEIVKQLDEAIPDSGQGSNKLELLRVILEAGAETASNAKEAFELAWPAIQKVVAAVVSLRK